MSRGLVALGAQRMLLPLPAGATPNHSGAGRAPRRAHRALADSDRKYWRPGGTCIVRARVRRTEVRLRHHQERHGGAHARGATLGGRARARQCARSGRVRAAGCGPASTRSSTTPCVRRPVIRLETEERAAGGARRTRRARDGVSALRDFLPLLTRAYAVRTARVLGGSSMISDLLWQRPSIGNGPMWSWDALEPYITRPKKEAIV